MLGWGAQRGWVNEDVEERWVTPTAVSKFSPSLSEGLMPGFVTISSSWENQ